MGERDDLGQGDGDDDLVAAAKRDPGAFVALYRRYAPAVYGYCYNRLGSREQAEDATSQIFLKALDALPSQRDDLAFRGWLFAIAHNVVTDAYRSRRRLWPFALPPDLIAPGPTTEEVALAAAERSELRALLLRLPSAQRRVLELRLAGLTGPEIASVLGKRHGAVKVAQSRAIARLRQIIAEDRAESSVSYPDPEEAIRVPTR